MHLFSFFWNFLRLFYFNLFFYNEYKIFVQKSPEYEMMIPGGMRWLCKILQSTQILRFPYFK